MDKHRDNDKVKWTEEQRNRVDFPRRDHREEYAAEVAPPMESTIRNADEDVEDASTARTVGYVGLVLGIASLFMWSVILGPIAAVVGYYAYNKGSKTTGAWSIGLGILATLSYFVLIPFSR
ncbi:hypothetical protein JCM10914A_35690 [Paenibacillus sp. JCM 10914]|uniref:hypothetical protein n=1 Tax=Paenibacillus sp. JCM 10914 TaxID=1236974 RepID=UPI0003CC2B02|nr:hypothetical protein [Paenibacillus sp. JCM 10914]GAE04216.1 hypothetical protein JCM10914_253 [Paenibacillus sp. JCM 10914]